MKYTNEKTGDTFDSLEAWGASIIRLDGEYSVEEAMYFYLDSYDCDYILEVLEEGKPLDSCEDSQNFYYTHRFLYRCCDEKIYGFIVKCHERNGTSLLVPFSEFEIKEKIIHIAVPKESVIDPYELSEQDLIFFPKNGD